jgi:hypothetical protein
MLHLNWFSDFRIVFQFSITGINSHDELRDPGDPFYTFVTKLVLCYEVVTCLIFIEQYKLYISYSIQRTVLTTHKLYNLLCITVEILQEL